MVGAIKRMRVAYAKKHTSFGRKQKAEEKPAEEGIDLEQEKENR